MMNNVYNINTNNSGNTNNEHSSPQVQNKLIKLQQKQEYEKRLLRYFTDQIREKGVTRKYSTIFKTAKIALLLEIYSPQDLYLLQILLDKHINKALQNDPFNIEELQQKLAQIISVVRNS